MKTLTTFAAVLGLALLASGPAARAQTTLYSTFDEGNPDALYDCCNSLPVEGRRAQEGQSQYAVAFTPLTEARVSEIDVALSADDASQVLDIVLANSDNAGLPGKTRHHAFATGLPGPGQCCAVATLSTRDGSAGIPVHAGQTYWVVVKTQGGSSEGAWNLNSIGLSGTYASKFRGGDWALGDGTLPGVRVVVH